MALAIVLLAFVLRVAGLGQDSLWFDTAHSAVVASNPTAAEVVRAAASDFQAPLYFLLLHFWLQVSTSDFWVALPTVFLGTATVALTCVTGARWFSPSAGLVAGLFAALTSYQVYYSRYPRGYMLLTFLGLLAAYAVVRAVQEGRARFWVLHVGAVVGALYTHPYGAFLLPLLWGYAAWAVIRPSGHRVAGSSAHRPIGLPQRMLPLALAAGAVCVAYLPWLGVAWWQWGQVKAGADSWIELVSRDSIKVLWDWLWFKTRLEYTPLVDLGLRAARYGFSALMLAALFWGRRHREVWLAAGLVAGPAALVFLISLLAVPLWEPRYLVMLSPFFAVWLGYALVEAGRGLALPFDVAQGKLSAQDERNSPLMVSMSHHEPVLRSIAFALLVLMALPPLASLYYDPAFRSPDIRASNEWIRGHYRQGDLILHINYQSYLPSLWYDHQNSAGSEAFPVPCIWESLPDAWCSGSPYREGYVNLDRDDFDRAVNGEPRVWLMALYNHNREGEAEEARGRVEQLRGSRFSVGAAAEYTGVLVYRLDLNPPVAGGTLASP